MALIHTDSCRLLEVQRMRIELLCRAAISSGSFGGRRKLDTACRRICLRTVTFVKHRSSFPFPPTKMNKPDKASRVECDVRQ